LQRGFAIARDGDDVSLLLQEILKRNDDVRLIVDHQNAMTH
jgi:hypothetical protein